MPVLCRHSNNSQSGTYTLCPTRVRRLCPQDEGLHFRLDEILEHYNIVGGKGQEISKLRGRCKVAEHLSGLNEVAGREALLAHLDTYTTLYITTPLLCDLWHSCGVWHDCKRKPKLAEFVTSYVVRRHQNRGYG